MIGRVYTVPISGTASPAAAFDLFELVPATAKPIRILRIKIGQTTEPPSEEEQLGISVVRGHTTSGSGGSAPTPVPMNSADTAAGFTAEVMNTTIASAGTTVTPFEDVWNTRIGFDHAFSPEECPESINGERTVIRSTAPADAITIRGTVWVQEMA
jgi:hypothetical protein